MKSLVVKLCRAALPGFLLLSACDTSPGGPVVQTMTLDIQNDAGKVDQSCISLPVLYGSIVAQTIEIDGGLSVTTMATNQDIKLSYTGTKPFEKTYAVDDIEYENWPLYAVNGPNTYQITLSLGCTTGSTTP
jgi:hypothetical protein